MDIHANIIYSRTGYDVITIYFRSEVIAKTVEKAGFGWNFFFGGLVNGDMILFHMVVITMVIRPLDYPA